MNVKIKTNLRHHVKFDDSDDVVIGWGWRKLHNSEYKYSLSNLEYIEMIKDEDNSFSTIILDNKKVGDTIYNLVGTNIYNVKFITILPKYFNYDGCYDLHRYVIREDGIALYLPLFEVAGFDYSVYIQQLDEEEYLQIEKYKDDNLIAEHVVEQWKAMHYTSEQRKKAKEELHIIKEKIISLVRSHKTFIIEENMEIINNPPFFCGFVYFKTRNKHIRELMTAVGHYFLNIGHQIAKIIPAFSTQSLDVQKGIANTIVGLVRKHIPEYELYLYCVAD